MQAGTAQAGRVATRADLIALGRSGRARDFIPIAAKVLASAEDPGLRFLLAANLASLGLRTLAAEEIDRLPEAARADGDVQTLSRAIQALPEDRVRPEQRRRTLVGNLRAIRVRDPETADTLSDVLDRWMTRLRSSDCFLAADGNLVRRNGVDGPTGSVGHLIDHRSIAAKFVAEQLPDPERFPRPLTIEGLDPPWLFLASWNALPRNSLGYAPPITLVQSDAIELLDGLSAADLREALVDPRVRLLVGPDASQRWLNRALERLDEVVIGAIVTLPGVATPAAPPLKAQVAKATAAQTQEVARLTERVRRIYDERDAAWWRARYAEAASGGAPLRVLMPISRYSTFVRHSAEDLTEAFARAGCRAVVHTEPTPHSQWSSAGHLRAVADFEPDLVVVINYSRGDVGLPYPENVPWVCWLQDAMPHQMRERRWGELDFFVGHLHREMRARAGFPESRAFSFPVVASQRKFNDAPVDRRLRERFECELAYVSHQSEPPEAFHARRVASFEASQLRQAAELVRPIVEEEAADAMAPVFLRRLERGIDAKLEEAGARLDPDQRTHLIRQYALPLADRLMRHTALEWARETCERRGWRLRLYGRGWQSHPTLAPFARGDVAHGEELRACYQAAGVHLHVSANTLVHQRVMECALSGGLPLCRLTAGAVAEGLNHAKLLALRHVGDQPRDAMNRAALHWTDHPSLMSMASQLSRLGLPVPADLRVTAAQIEMLTGRSNPGADGLHAPWLLGDLSLTTFRNSQELESLATRAIEQPRWREQVGSGIARRVRERSTTDRLAASLLELIESGLEGSRNRAAA